MAQKWRFSKAKQLIAQDMIDGLVPVDESIKDLEKLFKDKGVRLYSGIVLNNAMGGWNPHAVDHTIAIGRAIPRHRPPGAQQRASEHDNHRRRPPATCRSAPGANRTTRGAHCASARSAGSAQAAALTTACAGRWPRCMRIAAWQAARFRSQGLLR